MKRFIGILQFMTRIPIPVDTGFDEDFHKGILYFPLVGLVLGILYYIIAWIGLAFFNPYIGTIMVLAGEVMLTGGLHLDGLGDTFDGLYSYRDKDRILEIMKDSRLGTNGLLAIMLVLMLKAGFIYEVMDQYALWLIIVMPAIARTMQVVACYQTKTPREKGMGNIFIGKVSTQCLIGAYGLLVLVVIVALLLTSGWFISWFEWIRIGIILSITITLLTIWTRIFIRSVYKKIDGITGDVLGAICELAELIYLVIVYMVTHMIWII